MSSGYVQGGGLMAEEKSLENRMKKFVETCGGWQVKFHANMFTKTGIPDVLMCVKGRFIAVEVKASKGRPSPLQIHHLKQIDNAGGYAILLYPDDYDEFKEFIKHLADCNMKKANTIYRKLKVKWSAYED
jgi:Holliday junction resolvase